MITLKRIFHTELLLLLRNKLLVIPLVMNVLIWGYLILAYEKQAVHAEERAAAFYSGFIWLLLFNLLMVGLFSVYMASKDRESEFESLVVTYRVKNAEWIIGKWLVAQLYGLCITLITLLVQIVWFMCGRMPFGDLLKNAVYVFVQMEGSFFLLISLGFLFGTILRSIFAYIVIPIILVLTLGLPFDYVGVAYSFDNPKLHLVAPFDYMFVETPYEGIWGIDRVFTDTLLHQLAVALLGMVILLATLFFFRASRKVRKEKKMIPALIVVILIPTIVLSGIRFEQYNQALEQYLTNAQLYVKGYEGSGELKDYYEWENSYYDATLDHTKYGFSMERADLAVQLKENNQIDVKSQLTIAHNGDEAVKEVSLTLYNGLTVTECESASKVTCTRDKDFVTVHFEDMIEPGEQFGLTLNYQGNILQYSDEGHLENAFIQKNRVYLPKEAGWYPLIGERQLIVARENEEKYFHFEQRNGRLEEDDPTAFTVNITNEVSEVPLALTIPEAEAGKYQGTTQYGLSLVGGNMKETTVDQIRVVGHPEVLDATKKAIQKHQTVWNFVEEWLDVPMTPSVIYVLNDRHSYLSETPSQEVLIWAAHVMTDTNYESIVYPVIHYLMRENSMNESDADSNILSGLMTWLIISEFQEEGSFRKWYALSEETELLKRLDAYEKQGMLSDITKYMYHQYAELEDKNDFDMETSLRLYERETGL